jgi:predicted nuclease of restriction endonuclease-like RecB superfamily
MLAPEHVRARRRGDQLKLVPLTGPERERARELADALLQTARAELGRVREEVELAWAALAPEPKEQQLFDGLVKLVSDGCEFGAPLELEPAELRRRVFSMASARRRELPEGAVFDRANVLAEIGAEVGTTADALERALYADLKGAQRLEAVDAALTGESLVEAYELGQLQAALLRAVRVTLLVRCRSAQGYRRLFHKLKFQRLLYRVEPLPDGSHRIEVDGPFSLFESVTKYGLQLASLVPALNECDHVRLEAELRWGKTRRPVHLAHELSGAPADGAPELRDDVAQLLERLEASGSTWRARPSTELLDLPGVGLCVPDLVFERAGRAPVYLEVLGFWSREAVWRRVELVERGLGARVLFAVSSRLRVSEAVLEGHEASALYVYKGTMSPRALLAKVEALGTPEVLGSAGALGSAEPSSGSAPAPRARTTARSRTPV